MLKQLRLQSLSLLLPPTMARMPLLMLPPAIIFPLPLRTTPELVLLVCCCCLLLLLLLLLPPPLLVTPPHHTRHERSSAAVDRLLPPALPQVTLLQLALAPLFNVSSTQLPAAAIAASRPVTGICLTLRCGATTAKQPSIAIAWKRSPGAYVASRYAEWLAAIAVSHVRVV